MIGTKFTRRAVIGLASAAIASAAIRPARAQRARDLRLGIVTPDSYSWNRELVEAAKSLKEASGGRMSLTVYPAGQLGPEAAMLQQLQIGSLDMAWITTTEIANRIHDFGAIHAPFLVRDITHASHLLRHATTLSLLEKLPSIGVVGIGFGITGMRQIYTRDATTSVADLRGKKTRIIPAEPFKDFYRILGTAPTPVSFPQVYDALANGLIDAIDMDFEGAVVYKLHDHLKTLLVSNHNMFATVALVSARVWGGLPSEDQGIIKAVFSKHLDAIKDKAIVAESEFLAKLRETKLSIRPVDGSFFGNAQAEWDKIWEPKAPILPRLRQVAAQL